MQLLRGASLRTQIACTFASVGLVTAGFSWSLLHSAVPVAARQGDDRLNATIAVVVALVVCGTVLAAIGAAAFLRSSIGRVIDDIAAAADEIAAGRFSHRIRSRRSDELGDLARVIDTMAARLEQLEQSRQRFLASVSHELRTPLTVARGQAFTLARREHDPERLRRLRLVDSEIERVAELVEDLMTASSMQVRPLTVDLRPTDLAAVAAACIERFRERAQEARVDVVLDATGRGRAVLLDAARMQQLLGNLLDNAIRHATVGTAVRVSLDEPRRGRVRLSVSNLGETLSPERLDRMFEPFVQGEGRSGAAGLGLAIASELARAHGTRLRVTSRGPRITFSMEFAVQQQALAAPAVRPRYAT